MCGKNRQQTDLENSGLENNNSEDYDLHRLDNDYDVPRSRLEKFSNPFDSLFEPNYGGNNPFGFTEINPGSGDPLAELLSMLLMGGMPTEEDRRKSQAIHDTLRNEIAKAGIEQYEPENLVVGTCGNPLHPHVVQIFRLGDQIIFSQEGDDERELVFPRAGIPKLIHILRSLMKAIDADIKERGAVAVAEDNVYIYVNNHAVGVAGKDDDPYGNIRKAVAEIEDGSDIRNHTASVRADIAEGIADGNEALSNPRLPLVGVFEFFTETTAEDVTDVVEAAAAMNEAESDDQPVGDTDNSEAAQSASESN